MLDKVNQSMVTKVEHLAATELLETLNACKLLTQDNNIIMLYVHLDAIQKKQKKPKSALWGISVSPHSAIFLNVEIAFINSRKCCLQITKKKKKKKVEKGKQKRKQMDVAM